MNLLIISKEFDLNEIDLCRQSWRSRSFGALVDLMKEIPDTPIYCTANAIKSLEGQYGKHDWNMNVVKQEIQLTSVMGNS